MEAQTHKPKPDGHTEPIKGDFLFKLLDLKHHGYSSS